MNRWIRARRLYILHPSHPKAVDGLAGCKGHDLKIVTRISRLTVLDVYTPSPIDQRYRTASLRPPAANILTPRKNPEVGMRRQIGISRDL